MNTKPILFYFFLGLMFLSQYSCGTPVSHPTKDQELGYLKIRTAGSLRSIGAQEAQEIQNILTLVLVKDQEVLSFCLDWPLIDPQNIGLSPGEYQLAALAGYRDSSSSDLCILLGSAESSQRISIHPGEIASAQLILSPILLDYQLPDTVYPGEQAPYLLQGELPGSFFSIQPGGNGNTIYPTLKLSGPEESSSRFTLEQQDQLWVSQGLFDLPLTNGEYLWEVQGPRIGIAERGTSLNADIGEDWRWPTTVGQSADSPALFLAQYPLEIRPWETGIDVTIGWEDP